ncbi:sugar phosphate isomerase/epimerase family protein [Cohnella candidum]|uniref:Sugar phosphate isomerase/epimerase n=1 Tax=Cohnella candidum TaxID=2674991 RepID=A0A3G3K0N9_9BACL|nr:sugar phosphate isomerase/epimerase family protein [Cohnella candidum]AYQ74010.1 sugar phosphate isomerase/epimerase [Cohnella candidum]
MKFGVSSYSLYQAMRKGEMDILGAIAYIAEIGGEHVEIVPLGFDLTEKPELVEQIRQKASDCGLEISNYAIGANFSDLTDEQFEAEIARVRKEVDVAKALGVKKMRHDVASSPDASIRHFLQELPRLAEACRRIADYAAPYGITTSVENHGFYIQASDRVQALIHETGRENFRTTLDIGNFLCVDEESIVGVRNNLPYASMVHIKDFYRRPAHQNPGEGWFRSSAGSYLRGAVAGQGDISMREVFKLIRASGYDGYLSLEFEGIEDCKWGARVGLENIKRLWSETENA